MSLDYKSVFLISLILVQGGAENAMDVDIETDVDNSTDEDWNRIIGGSRIDITDAPYQVSFEELGQHVCGGSIISEIFIITAAHCTVGLVPSMITIRAGSSYRQRGGQVIGARRLYQHPRFNEETLDNDISIIQLRKPLIFNNKVQKVYLPRMHEMPREGTMALVTGWGLTDAKNEDSGSEVLRFVRVPIMSSRKCERYYQKYYISAHMFCAGYDMGQKDACQEDSGGPLVVRRILFGIISFGLDCAGVRAPGVYTKVSSLRNYIRQVTRL